MGALQGEHGGGWATAPQKNLEKRGTGGQAPYVLPARRASHRPRAGAGGAGGGGGVKGLAQKGGAPRPSRVTGGGAWPAPTDPAAFTAAATGLRLRSDSARKRRGNVRPAHAPAHSGREVAIPACPARGGAAGMPWGCTENYRGLPPGSSPGGRAGPLEFPRGCRRPPFLGPAAALRGLFKAGRGRFTSRCIIRSRVTHPRARGRRGGGPLLHWWAVARAPPPSPAPIGPPRPERHGAVGVGWLRLARALRHAGEPLKRGDGRWRRSGSGAVRDDADEDERGAALGLEPWGAGAAQEGAPGKMPGSTAPSSARGGGEARVERGRSVRSMGGTHRVPGERGGCRPPSPERVRGRRGAAPGTSPPHPPPAGCGTPWGRDRGSEPPGSPLPAAWWWWWHKSDPVPLLPQASRRKCVLVDHHT